MSDIQSAQVLAALFLGGATYLTITANRREDPDKARMWSSILTVIAMLIVLAICVWST